MSDAGYSSDEESGNYPTAKSQVILGYVDTEITETEVPTIEDAFVGHQPIWLHKDSKPDANLLKCLNCGGDLSLLLQAFAPLDGELYDRVIYVFACGKNQCNRQKGSIRAIRGVHKDTTKIKKLKEKEEAELKQQLADKLKLENQRNFLFGDNNQSTQKASNPFSGDSNPFSSPFSSPFPSSGSSNPFASVTQPVNETFASVATKAAPPKPKPTEKNTSTSKLPEFPGYFLYTDDEKFKKIDKNQLPEGVEIDENALDLESEIANSSNAQVNADYAKLAHSLTDEDFQKFSDVVSHNSFQVLRYDLGGEPLLYSSSDDVGVKVLKHLVPNPGYNPSSSRQFELQVMPKLIIDVEKNLKDVSNGMEWVTILVFSDKEDYIPEFDSNHVGYVEEWCGTQWEETTR
jgi:pre-rRNA-processing protein TSR4